MRQDDTSSGWEIGQEVNYQRPTPRPATPHPGRQHPDSASSQIPVLATLPDLDAPPAAREHPTRHRSTTSRAARDGRLISQALSVKLLAGGALLLVALAVVPWMFGDKKGQTKEESPDPGLPAWQQDAPPKFAGSPPRFDQAAKPVGSLPQVLAEAPKAGPPPGAPVLKVPLGIGASPPTVPAPLGQPDPAQHASAAPEATGAPGWPTAPLATPQVSGGWPQPPQPPAVHVPPHEPLGNPHPSAAAPNYPLGNHAHAMQPMQIQPTGQGTTPPAAPGYPGGAAYPSTSAEPPPPAQPGSWDPRFGAAPPNASPGQPMATQPGVANFQGIIESPPVRTTHDYTRPGIH